jgi:uncharacterized membrane protein YfcA
MVGGGGLIQLPAMLVLMPQLTLAQTLATNKTASFCGTAVATAKYLRRVPVAWRALLPAILAAGTGSFGGALLVSYFHKEQFMPFIICALLLVLVYTVVKKDFGLHREKDHSPVRHFALSVAVGVVIGFYDGLIGPGTGSFLIFAFVLLFGNSFLQAAAHAKIINCVTNASAILFFLFKGAIIWPVALPVAAANMLGNYTGAHLALRKGNGFIRIFFILVVLALILKLSLDYFTG